MTSREAHIIEINRIKDVLSSNISSSLRRDYTKALWRKIRELKEYDNYRKGAVNG